MTEGLERLAPYKRECAYEKWLQKEAPVSEKKNGHVPSKGCPCSKVAGSLSPVREGAFLMRDLTRIKHLAIYDYCVG